MVTKFEKRKFYFESIRSIRSSGSFIFTAKLSIAGPICTEATSYSHVSCFIYASIPFCLSQESTCPSMHCPKVAPKTPGYAFKKSVLLMICERLSPTARPHITRQSLHRGVRSLPSLSLTCLFASSSSTISCGLIVMWTMVGAAPSLKPKSAQK